MARLGKSGSISISEFGSEAGLQGISSETVNEG